MNHILIIDDDRKLRELLQEYLKNQGFSVQAAESAEKAHGLLADKKDFDLIIVDVMMPGETGLEFTRKLKQQRNDVPVLMLTARGDVEDRIAGLESGADDYLSKPFEPKELYLRALKLMERSRTAPTKKDNIVRFGDMEFNLDNYVLMKAGERIGLSSTEVELMSLFCRNINVPVDRAEVSRMFNGISERSIDVQITRLRKKIETDPKEPMFIQTSRGKGYVFRI